MRTTSYKSIRDGVISRMGIDPAQTLMDSQATALAEYLTTAAATSWTFFDWPEIYLTEERTPNGSAWFVTGYTYLSDYVGTIAYFGRAPANSETTDLVWRVKKITTNNNGDVLSVETAVNVAWDDRASATYAVSTNNDAEIPYILLDQDNLSPIGEIMAIWDADPTSGVYARKVRYLLNEDRVLLIDATSETGNVWVQFLLPQPRFTTDEYSAGAAYSAGDGVYYPTIQIAARSSAGIVQPVQATPDGALRVTTGFALPLYDKFQIYKVGATNNTDYTEYSFGGTAVARIRMTYFGGVPTTDNAQLQTSFIQYPPF